MKENLMQNLSKIDEKIEGLERRKSEIKEVSLNIEKSLQQFKSYEPSQISENSHLSKKKSINFEEFKKEKMSKEWKGQILKWRTVEFFKKFWLARELSSRKGGKYWENIEKQKKTEK